MSILRKSIFITALLSITLLNSCATANAAKTQQTPATTPLSSKSAKSATSKSGKNEGKILRTETGLASWYSIKTNYGTKTASGRPLRNNDSTAAHKTLPLGSKVRVVNLRNGKSEVVTITDRGPYIRGRIIDVTTGVANRIGFYGHGVTRVRVEVLSRKG